MDSTQPAVPHIRVFIISDVRLHREGLAALLRECPSIEVLGTDSVQEMHNALPTATDVALVDAPSAIDSETVSALRRICAGMRIVALGVRETASEVLASA